MRRDTGVDSAEAFVKDLMVSPREDQAADHPINYLRPGGQEAANRGNEVPRDREVRLGEVSPGSDLCCSSEPGYIFPIT